VDRANTVPVAPVPPPCIGQMIEGRVIAVNPAVELEKKRLSPDPSMRADADCRIHGSSFWFRVKDEALGRVMSHRSVNGLRLEASRRFLSSA